MLVGKDQQQALLHLAILQYAMQFLLGFIDSIPILRVNDKDETLCASVVMPPEWTDLVLPSDILSKHTKLASAGAYNSKARTQTLNLTFLYVTVSTLKPTVGIVVTD